MGKCKNCVNIVKEGLLHVCYWFKGSKGAEIRNLKQNIFCDGFKKTKE